MRFSDGTLLFLADWVYDQAHIREVVMLALAAMLGWSGLAEAKAPLEHIDGLYLGAGLAYVERADYGGFPLAVDVRYAPMGTSKVRGYGRMLFFSQSMPTAKGVDEFRNIVDGIPESESGVRDSADIVDKYTWRESTFEINAGAEVDLGKSLFFRGGLAFHHRGWGGQNEANKVATARLVPSNMRIPVLESWYTSQTNVGLFVGVGTRKDLGPLSWEPSLTASYLHGVSVGGQGLFNEDPAFLGSLKETYETDFSRGSFATSYLMFTWGNHLNIGAIAVNADVNYGQVYPSEFVTEEASYNREAEPDAESVLGVLVSVGFEFGHGGRTE